MPASRAPVAPLTSRRRREEPADPLGRAVSHQTGLGVLYQGDAGAILPLLQTDSVDCIIGSPPYYSVRDYGVPGQIGLEPSVDAYIDALCGVYDLSRGPLKPGGSCWVVIGDLYIEKNLVLLPARFALEMRRRGWILRNDVTIARRLLSRPLQPDLLG